MDLTILSLLYLSWSKEKQNEHLTDLILLNIALKKQRQHNHCRPRRQANGGETANNNQCISYRDSHNFASQLLTASYAKKLEISIVR